MDDDNLMRDVQVGGGELRERPLTLTVEDHLDRVAQAILRAHHPELVEGGDAVPFYEKAREHIAAFNEISAICSELGYINDGVDVGTDVADTPAPGLVRTGAFNEPEVYLADAPGPKKKGKGKKDSDED